MLTHVGVSNWFSNSDDWRCICSPGTAATNLEDWLQQGEYLASRRNTLSVESELEQFSVMANQMSSSHDLQSTNMQI